MTHRSNIQKNGPLIRLGDAVPESLRYLTKFRGRIVFGCKGNEIGVVIDIYIDSDRFTPQYLQVELRDMPKDDLITLIPFIAVAKVTELAVYLNEPRDRVVKGPRLPVAVAQQRFLLDEDFSARDWLGGVD